MFKYSFLFLSNLCKPVLPLRDCNRILHRFNFVLNHHFKCIKATSKPISMLQMQNKVVWPSMGFQSQLSTSIKVEVRADAVPFYAMHIHNAVHYHQHAGTCLFPRKIEPYSLFIEVLRYSKDIHSLMALWLGCCEARRCYFWKTVYQLKANSTGLLSNTLNIDWLWLQMNIRRKLKVHCWLLLCLL